MDTHVDNTSMTLSDREGTDSFGLRVAELSVQLNQKTVLSNISFALGKGEVLGVAGRSGSGKSMLALAIMNLLPEAAHRFGDIETSQTDLSDLSEKDWQTIRGSQIAMIFQEPATALNPVMTIGDQIAEMIAAPHAFRHPDLRSRVQHALADVGLEQLGDPYTIYPHQLSGGQRQRIMIAMAVMAEPDIVIADEPTTALDMITQAEIVDLLVALTRKRNISLLFITHDLALLHEYAHRILILDKGRVAEVGDAQTVWHSPASSIGRELVGAAREVDIQTICEQNALPHHEASDVAPLLSVKGVGATYPRRNKGIFEGSDRVEVIKHLSFDLFPGEMIGIAGPSGCGKSTLLRCLAGLKPIASGSLSVKGLMVEGLQKAVDRSWYQSIQMVFQDPGGSLNPIHNIKRILSEPLNLFSHTLFTGSNRREIKKGIGRGADAGHRA